MWCVIKSLTSLTTTTTTARQKEAAMAPSPIGDLAMAGFSEQFYRPDREERAWADGLKESRGWESPLFGNGQKTLKIIIPLIMVQNTL